MADEVIRRDEVTAALGARRELGPDYEDPILDAFMEKLERRLEDRLERSPERNEPPRVVVPLASLGLAIPRLGVAGGTGGFAGIVAVCLAIVLVNFAYVFGR